MNQFFTHIDFLKTVSSLFYNYWLTDKGLGLNIVRGVKSALALALGDTGQNQAMKVT